MSADLAIQKAIRARLVSTPALTALVPASGIVDRNEWPAPMPAIVLGESQELDEDDIKRKKTRIYATLHVWIREPSLEGVKRVSALIKGSIGASLPALDPGFHCMDWHVSQMRYLRDRDGKTSHGVVTVDALVREIG